MGDLAMTSTTRPLTLDAILWEAGCLSAAVESREQTPEHVLAHVRACFSQQTQGPCVVCLRASEILESWLAGRAAA